MNSRVKTIQAPVFEKKRSPEKVEICICFHIEMGKMGITFHKINIEHPFGFSDCFFEYKRKKASNSCKNEQVIHKLFAKCGKLGFCIAGDVENSCFFVDTVKEPQ